MSEQARESPAAPAAAVEKRPAAARSVKKLDFSQPNKFTTELRRRIQAAIAGFCGELGEELGERFGCHVSLQVSDVEQRTWAAAKSRLPADALALAINAGPPAQQMLLSIEQPWLLQSLECLLGGLASQAPAQRHLSEIDWALAKDLLDDVVAELSSAWSELGGGELRRGAFDLEGDAGLVLVATEPTLAVAIASEIDGCAAELVLLLPWPCVEPLAEGLREAQDAPQQPGSGSLELGRGVAGAKVLLRAEVGSREMPIERMRAIAPGSLLELDQRAEDGVLLFAEAVSLGRGRPGASGNHRAIKLTETDEQPVRSETYAALGRRELQRARAEGSEQAADPVLSSIFVRVWAELGRTHVPLGAALELAVGSVVELDQSAEAPVELFANGKCFANGSLVVTPEGVWGVEVAQLL